MPSFAGVTAWRRREHEQALQQRLEAGLATVPNIRLLRQWPDATDRVGIVSLVVDGIPSGLVAACLFAEHGIGVRDGMFCAHPLMNRIAPDGGVRLSLGVDSCSDDVERAVNAIRAIALEGPTCDYMLIDGRWSPSPDPRRLPDVFGKDRLDRILIARRPCRPEGA